MPGVFKPPNAIPAAQTSATIAAGVELIPSRAATMIEAPSASRVGPRRPTRSDNRPSSGLITTSRTPAAKNVTPIARAPKPPRESAKRAEQRKDAEQHRENRAEPQRPQEARVADSASKCTGYLSFDRKRPARRRTGGQEERERAHGPERQADTDRHGHRTEQRPDDRAEDRCAKRCTDRLPLRSRGAALVTQVSAPAQVVALATPWTKRASPSSSALPARPERETCGGEEHEADDRRPLRAKPTGRQPARNPTKQHPASECCHEQPCASLREAETLRVPRKQRNQRAEEHRVDEDDRADERQKTAQVTCARRGLGTTRAEARHASHTRQRTRRVPMIPLPSALWRGGAACQREASKIR